MSTVLSRDAILGAEDLPREKVHVPEWDGDIWVRTMMASERDDFEAGYLRDKAGVIEIDRHNLRASLLVRCVIDEAGVRLFADTDIEALGAKSAAAVDRLYAVAARLNRLSAQDEQALIKN
jgi:hypothetical protein